MRTASLVLAAAAAALAACSDPQAAPAAAGPAAASGTLQVADQAGRLGPLRLAQVERLQLDAAYRGTPGAHALRVDVTGPNGAVYTQLRAAIEAGADGRANAASRLEVRGTPIDGYHMVGAWKFALVVDDTPLASAAVDLTE